jgi:hypothetical protein
LPPWCNGGTIPTVRVRKTWVLLACLATAVALVAMLGRAEPAGFSVSAATAAPAKPAHQLLGIVHPSDSRAALAPLDTASLRPLKGTRPKLGIGVSTWAFSPDRSRLVVARTTPDNAARISLRWIDVTKMRVQKTARIGQGYVVRMEWLRGDRLLVLVGRRSSLLVFVFDAARRRFVRSMSLPGEPLRIDRAADTLVVLRATQEAAIAPTMLSVIDAEGSVRSAQLHRVLGGVEVPGDEADPVATSVMPALAVDPATRTAYAITAANEVAAVPLDTLNPSYAALREPKSILARLSGWLQPSAEAKVLNGTERLACWLGNGAIAVWGSNYRAERTASDELRVVAEPSGVKVVDVSGWQSKLVDSRGRWVQYRDAMLLVTGSDGTQAADGPGLSGYRTDGAKQFTILDGESLWIADVYNGLAYVGDEGDGDTGRRFLRMVDLSSGQILGRRQSELPLLLIADSGPQY